MRLGYEILTNFIDNKELQTYLDTCKEPLKDAYANQKSEYYSWISESHLNKVNAACELYPNFLKLASNPLLVNKAKQILQTDKPLDVYISKFFPMSPNGGISTYMHQDNYYFRGDSKKMVSCAVYLQDTRKENGCLRIAENSHLDGIFEHTVVSEFEPNIKWISEDIVKKYKVVDLELPAPYAVFFDINSIHGCHKNNSQDTRYSLAWEYIESDNDSVPVGGHISFDRNRTI